MNVYLCLTHCTASATRRLNERNWQNSQQKYVYIKRAIKKKKMMYCLFGRYYLCCDSWSGETINLSAVSPVFMLGIFEIKSHNTHISLFHKIRRIRFCVNR